MSQYRATRRDKLAHWLANQALHLATREYRAFLHVTYDLGMTALDKELGIQPPRKEE